MFFMTIFLLQRLLFGMLTLLGVTLITYALVDLAPGDPVSAMISPLQMATLGEDWVERERERLGLGHPWIFRYGAWLGELLTGNFGYSIQSGRSVADQIGDRLGNTLALTAAALLLSTVMGIGLGILAAMQEGKWLDGLITALSLAFVSIPGFFLGLLLIYVFALRLDWLPTGGTGTAGQSASVGDFLMHLILPASVLAGGLTAGLARYTRSAMIETLAQEYMRVAWAKGLRARRRLFVHALRNALLPVVTIIGLRVPLLFSGAFIIEQVFFWEGLGKLGVEAVLRQDFPLVMALNLLIAVLVVLSNLTTDLLYAWIDPRIRYE